MQTDQVIYEQSAETAIISCLCHGSPEDQKEIISTIREDHFFVQEHRIIFNAILRTIGRSIHADYINIKNELEANNQLEEIGGDPVLTEIASFCPNAHNWKRYYPKLEEARYRRSLEYLASDMIYKARDRDLKLEELKNWSETSVMKADYLIDNTDQLSIKGVVERALDNIESTMRGEPKIGIRTGLVPVDDLLIFGMRGGDMVVLAARPAVGKTKIGRAHV
jgi:replicative DNA helicase